MGRHANRIKDVANTVMDEMTEWLETAPYDVDGLFTEEDLGMFCISIAESKYDDYCDMRYEEERERKWNEAQ